MAIRKMTRLGEIYTDDSGKIIIKTKSGNFFTLDEVSDLTSIEAKDVLLGDQNVYRDNEDDDQEVYDQKIYRKTYAVKQMLKDVEEDDYYTQKVNGK